MTKFLSFLLVFTMLSTQSIGQSADTTWVQTYTWEAQNDPEAAYDSPGRKWFQMPEDDGTEYQKILMYYNLKCFQDGTAGNLGFPCGEWDYLTYTYLYDHTGLLDSILVSHPQYLVDNQDFETAGFASSSYSNWQVNTQTLTQITEVISEEAFAVGLNEDSQLSVPFSTGDIRRTQIMWRAEELTASGLVAGPIQGITFELASFEGTLPLLQIKWNETDDDSLSIFKEDLMEVYNWNTTFLGAGQNAIYFNGDIVWDGLSNLVLDISYENVEGPLNITTLGQNAAFDAVITSLEPDGYVKFDGQDEIKVPAGAFENISTEVTVSFWLNGDVELQPENSTVFEGVNSNNQRVLNSHLPWGNGRVYWDAGQDGGYDRIDKAANTEDYEGVWVHWAFTKNTVSGEMKIFKNGVLWHSDTGKDNLMDGIVDFSIGAAAGWSNFYDGKMDEFRVWSKELGSEDIADWMYRDLMDSHPEYASLEVYYKFNEEPGQMVQDYSGNDWNGTPHGSPTFSNFHGEELFRNLSVTESRPFVSFLKGEYTTEVLEAEYLEEVPVSPLSVSEWQVAGNAVELVDVNYFWPEGYSYTWGSDGMLLDSLEIVTEFSIENSILEYFEPPFEVVDRYELGRYITPYGINLSLGDDGWTWIFDVTDFAPFLKDSIDISAGNWQELLDMKFAFIQGTPPREVKRVERIWNGNWGLNNWEESIAEKTLTFDEGDVMAKVTATTTGHGFGSGANCAEFCYNIHSLEVNGSEQWSWEIMQECADNPLYPQGGTWIYDRAGWCPGMESRIESFEITPWIGDGEITLDYDINEDPYGNYVFESYMFTYGDFNMVNDVEISEILAPTDNKLHSRYNPMCNKPKVKIRNNGSANLTSCLLTYGVQGAETQTMEWTGDLGPLESAEVELEYDNAVLWEGDDEEYLTFEVSVDSPNGVADEQPSNNTSASGFYRPVVYNYGEGDDDDNRLILWLVTNNTYWETSYSLYDIDGDVVYERDDFTAGNSTFRDTIQLNQGCYMFHLKDSDDDGLSFFANNDGSGSMRFKKVQGPNFHTFEDDFGKEIKHYFFWKTDLVSTEELPVFEPLAQIFPNPGTGEFYLKLNGFGKKVDIQILSSDGKLLEQEQFVNLDESYLHPINLNHLSDGLYFVTISDGVYQRSERVLLEK